MRVCYWPPVCRAKVQMTKADGVLPLTPSQKQQLQKITEKFLHLARSMDDTAMHALNKLANKINTALKQQPKHWSTSQTTLWLIRTQLKFAEQAMWSSMFTEMWPTLWLQKPEAEQKASISFQTQKELKSTDSCQSWPKWWRMSAHMLQKQKW